MIFEKKLDDGFSASEFILNGFSTQHHFDRNEDDGGIILYVREDILSNLLSIEGNLLESFFVVINLRSKKKMVNQLSL